MPKKRKINPAQTFLAFPPVGCDQVSRCWHRLKLMYPDEIILLVQRGFYYAAEADARIVSQVTGLDLIDGECPICSFEDSRLLEVLCRLSDAERPVVICEPPSQPNEHLFF